MSEDSQIRQRKSNHQPSSMVPKVSNNEEIVLKNMNKSDYLDTNDNKGSYIKINSRNIDESDAENNNNNTSTNVLTTSTDDIINNSDDFIEPLIRSTHSNTNIRARISFFFFF